MSDESQTQHIEEMEEQAVNDGALDIQEAEDNLAEEVLEDSEGAEKAKKRGKRSRAISLEMLTKKFKSPIQGRQRKVQDWEDRTCSRLKALGFRTVPLSERITDICTFELVYETEAIKVRAVIRSEHSQWSSVGKVRFIDETPAQPEAQSEPATQEEA